MKPATTHIKWPAFEPTSDPRNIDPPTPSSRLVEVFRLPRLPHDENFEAEICFVCLQDWVYFMRRSTFFPLAGMPFTTGVISRRGVVSTVDAPPVALLKRAGAIPLGVTNTSELCMWLESHNHLYGVTNNPYDLERIPGGSSGQHLFDGLKVGLESDVVAKQHLFRAAYCRSWCLCLQESSALVLPDNHITFADTRTQRLWLRFLWGELLKGKAASIANVIKAVKL